MHGTGKIGEKIAEGNVAGPRAEKRQALALCKKITSSRGTIMMSEADCVRNVLDGGVNVK